jgi:hypothetical protein
VLSVLSPTRFALHVCSVLEAFFVNIFGNRLQS